MSSRRASGAVVTSTIFSPLRPSGTATAAWECVRPQGGGDIFHHRQRHRFAADLGEALEAATDGDEAVVIDRHDVAGIVPAVPRRHDHARRIGLDIALHDVGAAHMKLAGAGDAFHRLQPRFHARHQPAHRAGMIVFELVDAPPPARFR